MATSEQIWEEFQASFLVKLYSADFHQTLDTALANTTNNATPHHHFISTITGGKPAQKLAGNQTFQRRRSKTGEELRDNIEKAVMPTPRNKQNKGDPPTPGFFMTEGPEQVRAIASCVVLAMKLTLRAGRNKPSAFAGEQAAEEGL